MIHHHKDMIESFVRSQRKNTVDFVLIKWVEYTKYKEIIMSTRGKKRGNRLNRQSRK